MADNMNTEEAKRIFQNAQSLQEEIDDIIAGRPAALRQENPSASIWATSTNLEGSEMERKKYWIILRDEGKPDLKLVVVRGPGAAISVEPYVEHEYRREQWRYEHGYYDDVWDEDEEPEDFIL